MYVFYSAFLPLFGSLHIKVSDVLFMMMTKHDPDLKHLRHEDKKGYASTPIA
jgi:hypothetical protein